MDVVRTKLEVPVSAGDLLSRPRLLERLDEVAAAPLVVLQAPAGYGKSSLLSQWHGSLASQGHCVAWLALDASDQDAIGILGYVAAALSHGGVPLDASPQQLHTSNLFATADSLIALIVNGVGRSRAPVFLFLDDLHLLGAPAAAGLSRLIERAPANLRLVMATRTTPELHLARGRARGQLLEVGIEDLRFTTEECAHFLQHHTGQTLDDGTLAALDQRTEGWIAGIKLACLALRREGGVARLSSFGGGRRAVSDFFAEEVLGSQPLELRDFLLKTAVLDRFCPALCEAVTGQPQARKLLAEVEQAGLFLLRLDEDGQWFRYHHLFADFLKRQLADEQPGLDRGLHLRASAWFWKNDAQVEAIEHALRGGDPQRAAELLEVCCQDFTYTGRIPLVRKFSEQIPAAVLHRYPRVLLTLAWVFTRNLRFEDARALLDTVAARLAEMERTQEAGAGDLDQMRFLMKHREMVLSSALDDAPTVERQCQQLIEDHAEKRHPYLRGTIYAQLLYARREQYQLADMERLQATAQGILARSGNSFAGIALQASIGPSLFFAGKSDTATRALEQALEVAVNFGGLHSSLAALPALPLSEIVYESNDLDRAEQLIEDTLPYATELGFIDQLMPGFITQARIRRARDDRAGAYRSLDEAMTLAVERKLERLQCAVVAERVKFPIQDGHPEQSARCLAQAGITGPAESLMPRGAVTTQHELRAIAWVRQAQAEDRTADALGLVKHWRSFCAARGATRSLIQWDILMAQILFVSGDLRAAQRALREAIGHAAASRSVRSFIDEGAALRSLLNVTYEANLEVLHPTDAFASELLDAFERPGFRRAATPAPALRTNAEHASSEGLYGRLSAKEREILALVSSGMRNREVARKLGMAEGSVKWYMQQVYDKVGTRRRLQAVERARQFGLIA